MEGNSNTKPGSSDMEDEQLYLLEVIVNSLDVFKEGILETFQSGQQGANKEETTDGQEEDEEGRSEGAEEKKDVKKGPVRVLVKFFDFPTIEIMEHEFKENEVQDEESVQTDEEPSLKPEGGSPPLDKSDPLYKSKKWEEMRWKAEGKRTSNWEMGQELAGPIPTSTASRFTSGKSCLFPMNPREMMNIIRSHPVEVQVHRNEAENEPAHIIGQMRMTLGQEFIDAIAVAETPAVLPVSAYIEDDVEVTNVFGEVTGEMNLLVRLSCFGPTIFTQFKYIQGEKGFKFSTSEGRVGRQQKSIVEEMASSKEKAKSDDWLRQPFFTGEDNLPLSGTGGLCDDKFKLPVPWRKIHDMPVSPKICGPKRLFKEKGDRTATRDCPLYNPLLMQQSGPLPSQPSQRNMFQCSCCQIPTSSPSTVPPQFGSTLPFQVQQLLPGQRGTGKGPLEIPPGIKFPCQFGQNWIVEQNEPMYVCTNQSINCPKHYPGLEQAPPHLKSAISGKEQSNTDHSTKPNASSTNTNIDLNRSNVRIIPCPNVPQERPIVRCGLDGLLDPNYHNLQNILQPGLIPPVCPQDSSRGAPSLCTCPKVPMPLPEPVSGRVKCECTNIIKSLKPIELPYTCPLTETQASVKPQTNTCPPCPPVPIRLPPPPPDCPLAKLLLDANNDEERLTSKTPRRTSNVTPAPSDQPQAKTPTTKTDMSLESSNPQINGTKSTTVSSLPGKETPRTSPTIDDTASEKESKRVKDKVSKVLQEEVDYYDKTTSGGDDVASRTTTHTTDSASTTKMKKQVKRKKKSRENAPVEPVGLTPSTTDKKASLTYIATAGIYPGLVIGHKNCVPPIRLVPKRMGWLWNIKDCTGYLKPGRGWRPGSIQTSVMKVIDNVKTKQSKERKAVKSTRSGEHTKKTESTKTMASAGGDAPLFMPYDESPTLHMHKKSTGLMYFSLVPPKEARRKGPKKKKLSPRGQSGEAVDATSSSDEPPVHFVIDPKNPDGKEVNPELYETEVTSTNSEDSYQLDLTAPSTLRYRQAQYLKQDFEIQVTEDDFAQYEGKAQSVEPHQKDGKEEKRKGTKKKGSTFSKNSKKSNASHKKKIKP